MKEKLISIFLYAHYLIDTDQVEATIQHIQKQTEGDFEIIVLNDGWYEPNISDKMVGSLRVVGERALLKAGVKVSKGNYFCRMSSTILLPSQWDRSLRKITDQGNLITTRLYHKQFNGERGKRRIDHFLIDRNFSGKPWIFYAKQTEKEVISETLSCSDSFWWISRESWDEGIQPHISLAGGGDIGIELSVRAWLTGKKVLVSKETWHSDIAQSDKTQVLTPEGIKAKNNLFNSLMNQSKYMNGQKHSLPWLLGRFWPVPTWKDTTLL